MKKVRRSGVRGQGSGVRRQVPGFCLLSFVCCLLSAVGAPDDNAATAINRMPPQSSLEEVRLRMDKWIETQQIISKESKDWLQSKGMLSGRLELVNKEIAQLDEKSKQAESAVAEAGRKREELISENEKLKVTGVQLAESVAALEADVRRTYPQLPEPLQTKLQPLYQRIPADPAKTGVSMAERFQSVLGILNELNKANNEISINYEVHNLADGKPSEVKVLYVGLAQAYYVSARGEAGIGRPSADGWKWEPSKTGARDILAAQEILQGKQTPAFVPLPVKIQ